MASVQDIETRIIGIDNMLKFVLSRFMIQDPTNPFSKPMSMLDLYMQALANPNPSPIITPVKE